MAKYATNFENQWVVQEVAEANCRKLNQQRRPVSSSFAVHPEGSVKISNFNILVPKSIRPQFANFHDPEKSIIIKSWPKSIGLTSRPSML